MKRFIVSIILAALILGSLQNTPLYEKYNLVIEAEAASSTYESEVRKIMSGMNKGWSKEEKLLYLHDYLVTHTDYDRTYKRYSAYNAIVEHKAVCQGYSEAYADLAKRAGIQAVVITSQVNNHAWNAVKLNDKWYYVDCTWDDPIGPSSPDYCKHNNFLRNEDGMRNTGHRGYDWVIGHWGDRVNGRYTSKTYENAHWRKAPEKPFTFLPKGIAYFVTDDSTVYSYNCNRGKCKKLVKDERLGYGAEMANVGDNIFINSDTQLFCIKKNSKKLTLIHELTDAEKMSGKIVDLTAIDNTIRYDIGSVTIPYFYKAEVSRSGYLDGSKPKEIAESSLEFDKQSVKLTSVGATDKVKATAKSVKSITWSSDNTGVATVNNGTITAVGDGTCRITATGSGVSASCLVRVELPDPEPEQDSDQQEQDEQQNPQECCDPETEICDDTNMPICDNNCDPGSGDCTAPVEVIPDTTWQQSFMNHYVRDGVLFIGYYLGGEKDLVIPAKAVVNGKECKTAINGTLIDASLNQVTDTVETISFEDGVSIISCYQLTKNCNRLKSIDLSGCDTSEVSNSFSLAYKCPLLETINLKGLDLSAGNFYYFYDECPKLSAIIAPGYLNPTAKAFLTDEWRTREKSGWSTESVKSLTEVEPNTAIYKYNVTTKKGKKFTLGSLTYKVTNAASKTVSVTKITGKKAVIPDAVVKDGIRYLVTGIDKKAAKNNKKLSNLTIGACVTTIGNDAFGGCTGLKNIKVNSGVISKLGKNSFSKLPSKAKLKVPVDCKSRYGQLWRKAGYPKNGTITTK